MQDNFERYLRTAREDARREFWLNTLAALVGIAGAGLIVFLLTVIWSVL